MATTKNVLGRATRGTSSLVGINLTTAGHLADALARAGRALAEQAAEGVAAAHGVGLVAVPGARLSVVADWADQEAQRLHDLVERLRRLDGGPARWTGGTAVGFAHPFRAVGVADAIVAALEAGDLATARRLLAENEGDPVLATVVLEGLGTAHLLQLLRVGQADWARPGQGADDQRAVVLALGEVFALAARNGTTLVTMGDLAREADAVDLPRSALALLFAGPARFPTEVLRAAVGEIVVPINALLLAQPGQGVGPWLVPAADGPLDARVVVLDAVARDVRASRQAVGSVDLDELLPGAVGYLDGGVALARVLLAATTPVDHHGVLVDRPLTTASLVEPGLAGINAQRVIEWIGRHREAPLAVQAELGRLATPWIGSFRSAGLDDVLRRHLPLDEEAARGFLTYAMARDRAADALDDAAWRWAAAELDHLAGPGMTGGGFDAVGSVLGIVTDARLDVRAADAADEDERIRRQAVLWRRATQLVLSRITGPARQVVGPIVTRLLSQVLPVADHELEFWQEDRGPAVLHEQLALDYLAASTLWANRAENGLPVDIPPQLLVDPQDPDQGLRNPLTLSAADAVLWTRWRSRLAATGPAPLQLAGNQFLQEVHG